MEDDATVRPARADDAAAIQRVARASWHAAYDDIIGAATVDERVDAWFDPERVVEDDVEPDARPMFVATVDGTVVAFAEAVPDNVDEATANLYRIYVAPDRWGEGLGSALLDQIEAAVRDRGFERLVLTVFAANDGAVQFYEAAGFDRTATAWDDDFDVERYEYEKPL